MEKRLRVTGVPFLVPESEVGNYFGSVDIGLSQDFGCRWFFADRILSKHLANL